MNEYAATKEDLATNTGGKAKPIGTYTTRISKAKAATRGSKEGAKDGALRLTFWLEVIKGSFKKQIIFENYLALSRNVDTPGINKFTVFRRNSFLKAIGSQEGEIPPGAPGGPDASVLNGTIVDISIEHEFQNVPGEEYSIVTSKSEKSRWATDGWAKRVNADGHLFLDASDNVICGDNGEPEPIAPRESLLWYSMSDDFDGVGDPEGFDDNGGSAESADEDGWG